MKYKNTALQISIKCLFNIKNINIQLDSINIFVWSFKCQYCNNIPANKATCELFSHDYLANLHNMSINYPIEHYCTNSITWTF